MTTPTQALSAPNASIRLRAALQAGSTPDNTQIGPLVDRLGAEPDFFVRDMLTWALTRHPKEETLPGLLPQLHSDNPRHATRRCTPCRRSGTRRPMPQ